MAILSMEQEITTKEDSWVELDNIFARTREPLDSDVAVIIIGVFFCLVSGGNLWEIVGIGTICNACFNGPLIQFFRVRVSEPILHNKGKFL